MKVDRRSKGTATLIRNFSARWGWVANAKPRCFNPREKAPLPLAEDAGYAPAPVLAETERKKPLITIGVRSPDRATRSDCYTDCAIPANNVCISHQVLLR